MKIRVVLDPCPRHEEKMVRCAEVCAEIAALQTKMVKEVPTKEEANSLVAEVMPTRDTGTREERIHISFMFDCGECKWTYRLESPRGRGKPPKG